MSNIDSQNGKYHPKGKNNLNVENLDKKFYAWNIHLLMTLNIKLKYDKH